MKACPPFGYRQTTHAERYLSRIHAKAGVFQSWDIVACCEECSHVTQSKVRFICSLTGAVVGATKTCSFAESQTLIGGVK